MKISRKTAFLLLLLAMLCAFGGALAESARVVTPGGALNMRKKADEKSKLVDSVPNRAMVEVEETEGEWSKITYKRQTGYVKTSFLKLPSALPGQTVYIDGENALLRAEPSANASIVSPIACTDPVEVIHVDGEWAQVKTAQAQGWTEVSAFSFQWQEPVGERTWMPEAGRMEAPCDLLSAMDKGEKEAALTAGQAVTVTLMEKDWCLVTTEDGCGYVPCANVSLTGPQDAAASAGSMSPMEAAQAAEAALKKKFKAFAKESLYAVIEAQGEAYRCGFFNDQDKYQYGALMDGQEGRPLLLADYTGFALAKKEEALLPKGEMALQLSADVLAVGGVLDISVQAWEGAQTEYILKKNGQTVAQSEPGEHFSAAYRPREAGEYTLQVTAKDADGASNQAEAAFTVDGALPAADGSMDVYSQKDGWWADKKYRHSNLGKSGCAIFALSHALTRMGYEGETVLPENLAEKYAYCLIPGEGTSNELLINTAARDFGFKTQKQLINDKKKIAQLIGQGVYFSFSIAKGHIAMVSGISEDGAMVRVIDSAPQATFERIVGAAQYYQMRSGAFRAALKLDDLPGARWYFETDEYGGLEYFLPMDYVAKRGVRLIQPLAGEEK